MKTKPAVALILSGLMVLTACQKKDEAGEDLENKIPEAALFHPTEYGREVKLSEPRAEGRGISPVAGTGSDWGFPYTYGHGAGYDALMSYASHLRSQDPSIQSVLRVQFFVAAQAVTMVPPVIASFDPFAMSVAPGGNRVAAPAHACFSLIYTSDHPLVLRRVSRSARTQMRQLDSRRVAYEGCVRAGEQVGMIFALKATGATNCAYPMNSSGNWGGGYQTHPSYLPYQPQGYCREDISLRVKGSISLFQGAGSEPVQVDTDLSYLLNEQPGYSPFRQEGQASRASIRYRAINFNGSSWWY